MNKRLKHEIAASKYMGKWLFAYDMKDRRLYFINKDFVLRIF